jgi:D-beta-D-heptose 7-phosphate kinase/D-beta-D-heptose 1-phosphate adenosyltransferase
MDRRRFREIVDAFQGKKILVVGDLMLDEYLWGAVSRISPEAPVPIVEVNSESILPGGAANVASNVAALGGEPTLVGVVGRDVSGERLLALVRGLGLDTSSVIESEDRKTTLKSRVIAHSQQVVRVDREDTQILGDAARQGLVERVSLKAADMDGIIIEDYDKGVLSRGVAGEIIKIAKRAGKFCSADPKRENFFSYQGVDLFKPNQREAEAALGTRMRSVTGIEEACRELRERLGGSAVLMTRGAEGMVLLDDEGFWSVPAMVREIYDPSGAGDTVIATATLAVTAGASLREAAIIANWAACIEVSKFGTATVSRKELLEVRMGDDDEDVT